MNDDDSPKNEQAPQPPSGWLERLRNDPAITAREAKRAVLVEQEYQRLKGLESSKHCSDKSLRAQAQSFALAR